jgi:hypothetical protein
MSIVRIYLIQHPVELIPSISNTVPIAAVHHKDDTLRVPVVMCPQRPDLFFQIRNNLRTQF